MSLTCAKCDEKCVPVEIKKFLLTDQLFTDDFIFFFETLLC